MAGPETSRSSISLDLHGILTDADDRSRSTRSTIYHTYPHVDFADTGARAARLLLRLMGGGVRPVIARVDDPRPRPGRRTRSRKSGCYGDLIRECPADRAGRDRARGRHHDRQSRSPTCPSSARRRSSSNRRRCGRRAAARRSGSRPSSGRFAHRMQGKLIPLDRAIAQARTIDPRPRRSSRMRPTRPPRARRATRTRSSSALRDAGYERKRPRAHRRSRPRRRRRTGRASARRSSVTLGGAHRSRAASRRWPVRAQASETPLGRATRGWRR